MIGLALLFSLQQQPDSGAVHAALREAVVAVYHEVFKTERGANSVRVHLQSFQRAGGLAEATDLTDLSRSGGQQQLTADLSVKCGTRRCPLITAERVQASNDSVSIFINVTQWLGVRDADFASSVGYRVTLVRRAGKFVVTGVDQVSIS